MHLAVHPMAAKQNPCAHTSPEHPSFPGWPEFRREAGLRTENFGTVVVLPGQETGAALALGLRWQGATTSRGASSWVSSPRELPAKQTQRQSQPFRIVQILTAQVGSRNGPARCCCDRAGQDGSGVGASLPCEAANLNCVHECQQVPWREEG